MRFAVEFSRSPVEKAAPPPGAPPGTVATALTPDSPTAGAGLGALSASPGQGMRPEPGGVPVQTQPKQDVPTDQPLRWLFPYGTNATYTVRQNRTPFETLRTLSRVHDLIRTCIETRKDQICQLTWDFKPRDMTRTRELTAAEKATIAAARTFFAKPDKRRPWQTWLRLVLEEVLSIDALSIYKRRTRGGQLYALEVKDGTTIRPLLDASGDTPLPPNIAYQQIIYGQPVTGGDCTVHDLMYRPRTVVVDSPYGLSPTESILLTVNAALNRQMFNLAYYSDGNIPEGLIDAPSEWNAEQIRTFQDYMDSYLSGNLGARRRLKVVGKGMASSLKQFKEPTFETTLDLWHMNVVCGAFAVSPSEIGFTEDVNKSVGDSQERMQYRRGIKPLANFVKALLDEVMQGDPKEEGGLGLADFEATYAGGEPDNKLIDTTITEKRIKLGLDSIDDVRLREGKQTIGLGPMVWTNEGPVFVEQLIASKNADPNDSDPKDPARPARDLAEPNTDRAREAKGEAPPEHEDEDDDPVDKAIGAELAQWRAVAIKGAKVGKARTFRCDVIPPALQAHVETTLRETAGETPTVAGVVQAFALIEKDRADDRIRRRFQVKYQRAAASHFAGEGAALARHLQDGIAAMES